MNEQDAIRLINDTPALQSLLYDFDLMPEQLEAGTPDWDRMMSYAWLWTEAIQSQAQHISELESKVVAQQARIASLHYYLSNMHSIYEYGFEHTRTAVAAILSCTDDLSALAEHDAKVLEEAAGSIAEQVSHDDTANHDFEEGKEATAKVLLDMSAERRNQK
jgi:hypothetical protein